MSTINWQHRYQRWMNYAELDPELRSQLLQLQADPQTLEDCFAKAIEFGTGGMRKEMGPGPNRINRYTIRKASEGLARYVKEFGLKAMQAGVVIAYDSRYHSADFAWEAAKVIGKHGIRVCLFEKLCPTPLLSFAVRYLGAFAGIVITASHNPPGDNGYKVYGAEGGQITLQTAKQVMDHINEVEDELRVPVADEQVLIQTGLLQLIGTEVRDAYLAQLHRLRIKPGMMSPIKIIFTPLHGTTYEAITLGLHQFGHQQVTVVREQANPDSAFSTVVSPNPEDPRAFALAIREATAEQADLILATDPDGDRLGVAVVDKKGAYTVLNGNQVGVLLLHYWLSIKQNAGSLPANGIVLKTIVTSELGRAIAASYGISTEDTLTGFKYIGEKVTEYEQTGTGSFLFGYEESNGYLLGDFVRDKDSVQAALLMADACAFFQAQGKSLYEVLQDLYQRYGYYLESLYSITLKGTEGTQKISAILSRMRGSKWTEFADKKIIWMEDYLTGVRRNLQTGESATITLPQSDLLKYWLEDESWFCIRPSGTEPKLKIYFGVKGTSSEDSQQRLTRLQEAVIQRIQ